MTGPAILRWQEPDLVRLMSEEEGSCRMNETPDLLILSNDIPTSPAEELVIAGEEEDEPGQYQNILSDSRQIYHSVIGIKPQSCIFIMLRVGTNQRGRGRGRDRSSSFCLTPTPFVKCSSLPSLLVHDPWILGARTPQNTPCSTYYGFPDLQS